MKKFTFRGLMAPVFTPFTYEKERNLNLNILPKYSDFLRDNGVEGVLVNGTTGEGVSLSIAEREKCAEAWVKECNRNKQAVMIQVGGVGLPDVQRLAAHAENLGVDAILCLADLFHRPKNAEDLLRYLQKVGAAAPKTPLLYYHIPGFTGIDVNMKEMLEKAQTERFKVPTLAGLKFTCNDLQIGASCLTIDEERYAVFLGSDTILAAAFCIGFDSAIGTTLNMMASLNLGIVEAIKGNDVLKARKQQRKLSAAVEAIVKHGTWISTMKAAMCLLSPIDVGPVRDPLLQISAEANRQMTDDLQKIGL